MQYWDFNFRRRLRWPQYHIHDPNWSKMLTQKGSGGCGQVVSMLAFYSDDPSSNPTEDDSFYSLNCLKSTKINEKEAGDGPFR